MKKTFLIAGILPLIGILIGSLFQSQNAVHRIEFTGTPSKTRNESKVMSVSSPEHRYESRDHLIASDPNSWDEKTREIDRLEKEVANSISPELQKSMLESWLAYIKPSYDSIFKSWNLDGQTSQKVMAIIQAQEAQMFEMRMASQRKGLSGASDLKSDILIANSMAENELSKLLNRSQIAEITKQQQLILKHAMAASINETSANLTNEQQSVLKRVMADGAKDKTP